MTIFFIKVLKYDFASRQSIVVKAQFVSENDLIKFFKSLEGGQYTLKVEVLHEFGGDSNA